MSIKQLIEIHGLKTVADEVAKRTITVRRWAKGVSIPRTSCEYKVLFFLSHGQLTPNSFHPIAEWQAELNASLKRSSIPNPKAISHETTPSKDI